MHHFVGTEGADVSCAETARVTQVSLLLGVDKGVTAESVFPLKATTTLTTQKWSFCGMTRLVRSQRCSGAEASLTSEAEEGQLVVMQL